MVICAERGGRRRGSGQSANCGSPSSFIPRVRQLPSDYKVQRHHTRCRVDKQYLQGLVFIGSCEYSRQCHTNRKLLGWVEIYWSALTQRSQFACSSSRRIFRLRRVSNIGPRVQLSPAVRAWYPNSLQPSYATNSGAISGHGHRIWIE